MIIGLFPELQSVGGVQLAGRQTAAALTTIAAERDQEYLFLSLNDARGEHRGSVAGIDFRFTGLGRQKGAFVLRAIQLARKKPKVILAAHPNLGPIAAMMKVVSVGARTIVGAHGIEVWRPLSAFRRRALRRADIVTAPSSDTGRRVASIQGVLEAKIRLLPWPLDPEFAGFAGDMGKLSLPAGFPHGQVILSVGRWAANERYKGADLLIRAIPDLEHDFPDIHLVLVGTGDDLPRLKEEAHNSGAKEHIHFLSGIPRSELAACYANSDVFALPSTGEGFGLVFLEAMAFGKPVLGANAGGVQDVIRNQQEGFLIEPSVDALGAALRLLLSDRALRGKLGAGGRQRVASDFTFARFQVRLLAIVNELLEEQRGAKTSKP